MREENREIFRYAGLVFAGVLLFLFILFGIPVVKHTLAKWDQIWTKLGQQ